MEQPNDAATHMVTNHATAAIVAHHSHLRISILKCILNGRKPPTPFLHPRIMGLTMAAVLDVAPNTMWRRIYRMNKESFKALLCWLQAKTTFKESPYMKDEEKLLIFMYIVCQGSPHGVAAYYFGRSDETINRYEIYPPRH